MTPKPPFTPMCQGCVIKCRQHPVSGDWLCPRCDMTCEIPSSDQFTQTKWNIDQVADLTDEF